MKIKFIDGAEEIREHVLEILQRAGMNPVEDDKPDFLFYSVFGYGHLKYDCVRIFWTGENFQPDFNICDYAIGFSHIEYEDRYCRVPLYLFYLDAWHKACKKHLITQEAIDEKKKFCNFVYSNKNAAAERAEFYNLLSSYKTVDSGGRYMNNVGGPVADKLEFQSQYKFSIAFENSLMPGYSTEKILHAFAAATIPIYWGDPRAGEQFNEKAFINCHKYSSFEEVVERVKEIDNNPELFKAYIKEPMYLDDRLCEEPLKDFEDYIIYICKQDPQKAIRRNTLMWGAKYEKKMKFFFLKYDALRKVALKIKNK